MKRILLVLLFLTSISIYSSNISGPKYRVEGGLGSSIFLVNTNVNMIPEWKSQITENFDVSFGPKVSLDLTLGPRDYLDDGGVQGIIAYIGGDIGFEVDFNIKVPNTKNKFYTGLEVGAGAGVVLSQGTVLILPNYVGKLTLGGKINDKANVGVYFGYGKGFLGLEAGYTFK